MDDKGLFYQLEPNVILATGPAKGKKKNKVRITVGLFSNATGTDKQKPLLIARAAKLRCFGKDFNPNFYITHRHNTTVGVTSMVFAVWLTDFECSMTRQKWKVLLLDNAASHKFPEGLRNNLVDFLTPNLTAHLQPNDDGIIPNFKLYYREGLTKHFLQAIENDKTMAINLLEELHLIRDACNYVKRETIQNC